MSIEGAVDLLAGELAGLNHVPAIGLGSGRTAAKVLRELGTRLNRMGIRPYGVPSSSQIKLELSGLFLITEPVFDRLDMVIDGADQISSENGYIIKGGGGALTRERIIWEMAATRHVFVSKDKLVRKLTFPLPVEIIPFGYTLVKHRLADLNLRHELRRDQRGYPVITENGNYIVDVYYQEDSNLREVYEIIRRLPGVLDVGLFIYDVNIHIIE
ncbi:MAG: ribose 5-phosphate isomerase A [Nitrososphaeria archaeon]